MGESRTHKPAAEVFSSFEKCFVRQVETKDGRAIYGAKDGKFILAGTELQALKAWNAQTDNVIRRLPATLIHELIVKATVERVHGENNDSEVPEVPTGPDSPQEREVLDVPDGKVQRSDKQPVAAADGTPF